MSKKSDTVTDMVPQGASEEELLNTMLSELQTLNRISILKEEDFVIRKILQGKSKTKVLELLKEKHPKEIITMKDINGFLLLYRDVLETQKVDMEKSYTRQLIKSKTGLNNELVNLAITAKDMSKRYDEQEHNSNAVMALRTAADILMKYAKVDGLINDTPDININMKMDKMVQNIANEKVSSRLKDLDDTVDGEFTEDGNEDS